MSVSGISGHYATYVPILGAAHEQRTTAADDSLRGDALDESESEEVAELQATDRRVRAHEQAHASVGGQYASAPQYTLQRGPDGVLYAVAGEVDIDIAPVPNDPEATIEKMQIVQAAALAPIDRSAGCRTGSTRIDRCAD